MAVNEDWGRRLRAARRAYEDRHDTRLSYTEIGRRVGLRLGRKPYSSPSARAWFVEGQEPESFAVTAAIAYVLDAARARPKPLPRLIVCSLLAAAWGNGMFRVTELQGKHRDFGQMWYAARTILARGNPYDVIGPGRPFVWDWPWYYPLPAGLAALPVAAFSEPIAVGIMAGVTVLLFSWALSDSGYAPLLAMTSIAVWQALFLAQWSPLLASAIVVLPVGVLLVVKPTIGAAAFAARPSWWAVGGGAVLLLASFIIQPHWVADWRDALASQNIAPGRKTVHTPPILYAGGLLVLVALTRWRRPEARLLIAMACVPQTTLPYEAAPLFLVPRGWIECTVMTALSWAMLSWVKQLHMTDMGPTVLNYGRALIWFLYLPAAVMVLRRPNEGPAPEWLERRIASWPAWIRGMPASA